jgi:hypothetical protein
MGTASKRGSVASVVIRRWCARGDTIRTVRPIQHGQDAGRRLEVTCPTPESCAAANDLIAEGTWEVSQCHRCGPVESCSCFAG